MCRSKEVAAQGGPPPTYVTVSSLHYLEAYNNPAEGHLERPSRYGRLCSSSFVVQNRKIVAKGVCHKAHFHSVPEKATYKMRIGLHLLYEHRLV